MVVFLFQGDEICEEVAGESSRAVQGSSGGLRENEGEECSLRIVRAEEEIGRAQLKNKSLMVNVNK